MRAFAELVYFFRHAMVRDAAYVLHLPSERAELHCAVLDILEATFPAQMLEAISPELAEHATLAAAANSADAQDRRTRELHWLRVALRFAAGAFRIEESAKFALRVALHPDADAATSADAMLQAGANALLLGRRAEARNLLRQTVLRATDAGDIKCALQALNHLAGSMIDAGEMDQARTVVDEMRACAGDDAAMAILAVNCDARLHDAVGETAEAERLYRQCNEHAAAAGETARAARILVNLGGMMTETGRTDEARDLLKRSIALLRQAGEKRAETVALGNLGWNEQACGNLAVAEQLLAQAARMAREIGSRLDEAVILGNLGNLYLARNDTSAASQAYTEALALHREVGNRRHEGIVLGDWAIIDLRRDQLDEAEAKFSRAIEIHREVRNRRSEGICESYMGAIFERTGRVAEAEAHFRRAIALSNEVGDLRHAGHHAMQLGSFLMKHGEREEGRRFLREALRIHESVQDEDAAAECRDLIAKAAQR
ncbi:MAG: tetratricopeptide repeat protein [Planctomycetes bacterium]|nr:tetratricopeptide repeat protein [Planctomycetota bacterium]